jgi:hypothetical protein
VYIKSVDENTKDVFLGKGWANWVRYTMKEGRWVRTAGLRPDHTIHRKIVDRIENFFSIKR